MVSFWTVHAQRLDTLGIGVQFEQGRSILDLDYASNRAALQRFVLAVNSLAADPNHEVNGIIVEAGASPEGSIEYNETLSMNRARSIRRYLLDNLRLLPSQIRVFAVGIDWMGLSDAVGRYDSKACPWRDDILETIYNNTELAGFSREGEEKCKTALMSIDDGRAWDWMMDNVFGDVRHASGSIRCVFSRPERSGVKDTVVIVHDMEGGLTSEQIAEVEALIADAILQTVPVEKEKPERLWKSDSLLRSPFIAVRSNLLMPLMNVGIEYPIDNRWSLEADWYSPWIFRQWMNGLTDYYKACIQGQALYVGGRMWLGRKHGPDADPKYRLLGHSVGINIAGVHYDMGFDYNGEQGDALALGVDYMYAMPLGRKGQIHLEFTLGVGGWWCKFQKYKIEKNAFIYAPDGETPISTMLISDGGPQERFGVIPFRAGVHLVIPVFTNFIKGGRDE